MRVRYEGGILVQDLLKEVILDPVRKTPGSVVSHGHMDHLTSGGIMTPETLDVLKIRRGGSGRSLPYGKEIEHNGFRIVLKDAGHVFGSAMIRVDDFLYTGDFNPEGGATCGKARPEFVEGLIVDATYGRPGYNFPPKKDVEADLLNWLEMELANGPVALAGYEFGKSQELIALVNRLGVEVAVSTRSRTLPMSMSGTESTCSTVDCPRFPRPSEKIPVPTSSPPDGSDRLSTTRCPGSVRSASGPRM